MGWSPLPAGTMKKEHDRLIGRYGRTYLDDYGWADGLIEPPLTFAGLEAKADLNYMQYLYVTGSHLIHASAHGMTLTIPGQDDAATLTLTGPSEPAWPSPRKHRSTRSTRSSPSPEDSSSMARYRATRASSPPSSPCTNSGCGPSPC
jgi:hypothetical protein